MRKVFIVLGVFAVLIVNVARAAQQNAPTMGEMELKIKTFEDKTIYAKTRIVPLKNVKASEVEPFIRSRLSVYGAVQVNDAANTMIVTDMEPKLSDLVELIRKLDAKGIKNFVQLETQTLFPKYVLPSKLDSIIRKNLSPEGSLQTDDDLNAIMITDVKSRIEKIKEILSAIDMPPRQVLIKGKLLLVESDWLNKAGGAPGIESKIDLSGTIKKWGLQEGPLEKTSAGELDVRISSIIDFGIREGKVNVKSFPTLVVQNNKTGIVTIPDDYYPLTFSFVPHIGEGEFINLEIAASTSDSSGISTTIMVRDDATFSIGGIEYTKTTFERRSIPIIGTFPLIGWLFKREEKTTVKKQLIVLITPHILELGESPKIEMKSEVKKKSETKTKTKAKKKK